MPAIAAVALALTTGLCVALEKLLGPLQLYVFNPAAPPVKVSELPAHTGLLLVAVAVGKLLTTTVVVAVLVHPFASVTVKVYVPAIAAVALALTTGL